MRGAPEVRHGRDEGLDVRERRLHSFSARLASPWPWRLQCPARRIVIALQPDLLATECLENAEQDNCVAGLQNKPKPAAVRRRKGQWLDFLISTSNHAPTACPRSAPEAQLVDRAPGVARRPRQALQAAARPQQLPAAQRRALQERRPQRRGRARPRRRPQQGQLAPPGAAPRSRTHAPPPAAARKSAPQRRRGRPRCALRAAAPAGRPGAAAASAPGRGTPAPPATLCLLRCPLLRLLHLLRPLQRLTRHRYRPAAAPAAARPSPPAWPRSTAPPPHAPPLPQSPGSQRRRHTCISHRGQGQQRVSDGKGRVHSSSL